MAFIADLHIHSKYSRACSRNLDLPNINKWCQLKGIDLVATADFTHPVWFKEIMSQLEPAEEGVFHLKEEYVDNSELIVPEKCRKQVRFILSTELSLIYKRGGRCRKVHHVILAPNFEVVSKINIELEKRGNIYSDGRPILGLDSRIFLEILLSISPDIQLIPAHVWTPHFSIFGSKSGFDSIEECFGDLSEYICAFETGLSSDPLMNWTLSKNDKYVLVSSSDAHSLPKLGREATVFNTKRTYPDILNALRHDHEKILGTIEFFPEEGKYHADGLREEGLCWTPEETRKHQGVSPRSGKAVTVGVLNRVAELADRPYGQRPKSARDFWHIIPLIELLSEILGVGPSSKRVFVEYGRLVAEIGPEFYILKDAPIEQIDRYSEVLAEAIRRMREGKVVVKPGYDGEYGIVKVLEEGAISRDQMKFF